MNGTRLRYVRYLKYIFLICIVLCGINVFVFLGGYENFARTDHAQEQKPYTTPFPTEIRNHWVENTLGDVAIYILSAIASNTSDHVMYERDIRLHGWIDAKDQGKRIKCCFSWIDGTISEFYDPAVINKKRSSLMASQIACPFNTSHSDVSGVFVTSVNSTCPSEDKETYIKPHLPEKANVEESFAICLKLVYANVDNILFIDWLEFYRTIKVDKIFMFTYNISETTSAIIRHYVQLGLVETRPFNHPEKSQGEVGAKRMSFFEDERVIIFDCLQRSSGYKYMTIVDMDEFLVPRKHGNVKDLMKYLMSTKPNAAGFMLPSYIFVKNVEADTRTSTNGSAIVKYFQRTPVLNGRMSRAKNIILPSRITANGLFTHQFRPNKSYKRGSVNYTIAAINHYRTCYKNAADVCSDELITDKFILKFVEKFQEKPWYAAARNKFDLG